MSRAVAEPIPTPRMPSLGRDLDSRLRQIQRITGAPAIARRLAYEGIRTAMQELLPQDERDGHTMSPEMMRIIIEHAIRRLREADADLDAENLPELFLLAIVNQIRNYDPIKAGDDLWWNDADTTRSFEINCSLLSNARLATYTSDPVAQVRYALAIAHVTIAKQVLKRSGAASRLAVRCELARHGLPNDPRYAKMLFRILADLNLIRCVDPRYWRNRCQRWVLCGATETLPFVQRFMVAQRPIQEAKMVERMARHNADTKAIMDAWLAAFSPIEYKFIPSVPDLIIIQQLDQRWMESATQGVEAMQNRWN